MAYLIGLCISFFKPSGAYFLTMEERYNREHLIIEPSSFQFKGADSDEPIVCSQFGCKNHLTPEQQLYGSKCISCQGKKEVDVAKYVSHPIKKSA